MHILGFLCRYAFALAVLLLALPLTTSAACNSIPIACSAGSAQYYESSSAECPNGNYVCVKNAAISKRTQVTMPKQKRVSSSTTKQAPGSKTLSLGARGEAVAELQRRLIALGFLAAGNDTGYFGRLTKAAVQAFQRTRGIVSSGDESSTGYGAIGPKTRASLAAGGSPTTAAVSAPTHATKQASPVTRPPYPTPSAPASGGGGGSPVSAAGGGGGGAGGQSSCPTYNQPICAAGEHVEAGAQDANGCAGAPRCVKDATTAPQPCTIDTARIDNCVIQ